MKVETKTYQGTPCKRGGHTERYVKGGHCVVCRKAYHKKWNAENPEKCKTYCKKWYAENLEKKKAHSKKYYEENKEECKAKDKKWRAENAEKVKAAKKKYQKENSKLYAYYAALRHARIKQQTPPWADLEKIKQIYLTCPKGHDVDHKHPLSKGGLHVHWNLQHLPMSENRSKGAKLDYESSTYY